MYLFLLVFGAVLSLAGVVLAASGLSIHDRTFDPTLFTPGIVAFAGGLLLIGLGFALRVLQRIENALAVRPMTARAAAEPVTTIAATATVAPELPSQPSRIPFPVKIARLPQTAPVAAPAPLTPAAEKRQEDLPPKFSSFVRVTPAPAIEEVELAPPRSAAPAAFNGAQKNARENAEENVQEDAQENTVENVGPFVPRAVKARNGIAPSTRVTTRLDARARAPLTTERPKSPAFDALWPKGPRLSRAAAQTAQTQAPAIPVAVTEPAIEEPVLDPSFAIARDDAAEPVTILKSGVVDGMAYTLYSDGSIEAQLPQGMLRFGSITELRAHIEQDSQQA
jgi:hypothetical protein